MKTLTPLEPWIKTKIGLPATEPMTRTILEDYQFGKLRETIEHARRHSPFYRRHLEGCVDPVSLAELARLPFTFPADLQADDLRFLCVSRGEIERIVTLASSGTTAPAKRLHFTGDDLELTVDFFRHGMSTLVEPGERVLILMPGELHGSVGDLLVKGLARMDVEGIVRWPVGDAEEVIAEIAERRITSMVGLPGQVLALVRHPAASLLPNGQIRSVLLSADYVPDALVREIGRVWGSPVFNHYGMTEMGLGGGVDCRALTGYHLREADLYFEIVDPIDGRPLPDGLSGEVVFTTLTRRGMPLIRYRTGDLARFIPGPCPCGSMLRRLGHVRGRLSGRVNIGDGSWLDCADLDEALYPLPCLIDYQAELIEEEGRDTLALTLHMCNIDEHATSVMLRNALEQIPAVRNALAAGDFVLGEIRFRGKNRPATGVAKKTIIDRRNGGTRQ
ncbi:MAG TPA: AMP-binding protein [Geobacteraceae bacterium]|nr:AMP-binding protein [Geobacteraceae bacterium]